MKQLRNILTGVLLACGLSLPAVSMQADSIPAAQNLSLIHICEVSALALLLGLAYMLWKKIITWHIPVSILATVVVFSGIMYWVCLLYTFRCV